MVPRAELDATTKMPHGAFNLPEVSGPADEGDVMREQLEYLLDHISGRGVCGCSACQRYLRVRSELLAIFSDPEPRQVQQLTATLPMAA
jgi:hypothetical protein